MLNHAQIIQLPLHLSQPQSFRDKSHGGRIQRPLRLSTSSVSRAASHTGVNGLISRNA